MGVINFLPLKRGGVFLIQDFNFLPRLEVYIMEAMTKAIELTFMSITKLGKSFSHRGKQGITG